MSQTTFSLSLKDLSNFAKELLPLLKPGVPILLRGPLGAGKTTLVKKIVSLLLSIPEDQISSPTFSLHHIYAPHVHHFDLYRLNNAKEVSSLGFFDIISDAENICFIEWPEKILDQLPMERCIVDMRYLEEDKREVVVR